MSLGRTYFVSASEYGWDVRVDGNEVPIATFTSEAEALAWCREDSRRIDDEFALDATDHDNGECDFGEGTGLFDTSYQEGF